MIEKRSSWAKWVGLIFLILGLLSFASEIYGFSQQEDHSIITSDALRITAFIGNLGNIFFGWALYMQKKAAIFWVLYGVAFSIIVTALSINASPDNITITIMAIANIIQLLVLFLVFKLNRNGQLY
jgi:peptidoglycan/LPS O-acetylase OafA/YrhL